MARRMLSNAGRFLVDKKVKIISVEPQSMVVEYNGRKYEISAGVWYEGDIALYLEKLNLPNQEGKIT